MIQVSNNIQSINNEEWNKLLFCSSTTSFFQSKSCYDFYASLSFMEPFVYAVKEKDILKGVIVGYLQKENNTIKHYFTRRAIIPGGILLSDDISKQALESLLIHCKNALLKKAIYIECRNYTDFSKYKSVFIQSGFDYLPHLNFYVDCTDVNAMNKSMSTSKLRQIKKSIKSGAEIVIADSEKQIEDFYMILKDLYTVKVKTPLFPKEYFMVFFKQKIGIYLLVQYQEEIIAGIMCPILENKVIYEMFVAGKDRVHKDIYPSILATYAAMKYASEHNIKRFDFMGAGKPDEAYGVREFKAKFGGELVEHGRFLCVLHPLLYQIGKIGVKILKKIR